MGSRKSHEKEEEEDERVKLEENKKSQRGFFITQREI